MNDRSRSEHDDRVALTSESIEAARRRLKARFADEGIDSAALDARLLVCAAAGLDHAAFVRDPKRSLEPSEAHRLEDFARRRTRREPISRILRHREFWGLTFAISPAVLDPRPETEGLVASALDAVGGRRNAPIQILDLGVGSGAILAALLNELPMAWGLGLDRSEAACQVARHNLERHGLTVRSSILCADWANALVGRFDLIVSNPPYIASTDLAGLDRDVREYDPIEALDGGVDGLDAYRVVVPCLPSLLKSGGIACFECGTGQGVTVAALMKEAALAGATVFRDLAGHDRILVAGR